MPRIRFPQTTQLRAHASDSCGEQRSQATHERVSLHYSMT